MYRLLPVLVRSLAVVCLLLAPQAVRADSSIRPDNQAAPSSPAMEFVTQVGGPASAVAVAGSNVVVGVGPRLVILDVTDPEQPRRIGLSAPILSSLASVVDIQVAGGFAYVAAGRGGLAIYDIRQPERPVSVALVSGTAYKVAVAGQLLFSTHEGVLQIWGIADRAHPQLLSEMVTPNMGYDDYSDVTVAGNYAYVAQSNAFNGVQVVDVTDPNHPVIIETLPIAGRPDSVIIAGNRLYVGAHDTSQSSSNGGLHIVDASNPQALVDVGMVGGYVTAFDVAGRYTYVLDYNLPHSLRVIDCTNPQNPHEIGVVAIAGDGRGLAASTGHQVYVAEAPVLSTVAPNDQGGLRIVDVTSPSAPAVVGFYDTPGFVYDVALTGNFAYTANGEEGLAVFDLTDLNYPPLVGVLGNGGQATYAVAIAGALAYAGEYDPWRGGGGLRIVDISNTPNLHTVGYIELDDAAFDLQVIGGYAYVLGNNSFVVIDVSNPQQPSARCSHYLDSGGELTVRANRAYIAHRGGVSIIDVSNTASCPQIGSIDLPGLATAIDVVGNRAYVGQNWNQNGIHIFDVTNPQQPQAMGFLATPNTPHAIDALPNRVYATTYELLDIDAHDPANPRVQDQMPLPGWPQKVITVGHSIYIAASYGGMIVVRDSPLATRQLLPLVLHRR